MRKVRRPPGHSDHDRWLVSYADFVTLLFAFFVVMYATAQVDRQKAERLSGAIRSAFQELGVFQNTAHAGPPQLAADDAPPAQVNAIIHKPPSADQPENLDILRRELELALAEEIRRNDVALHMDAEGLVVSLREIGFFASGSATLKPGAEQAFARVAAILRRHSGAVRIEGHTDNVPIHTPQFASNWELSTARATELVKALTQQYGIDAERLSAAGYAEFHPVAGNDSAKGRQLNRRVDVVILRTGGRWQAPTGAGTAQDSSDAASPSPALPTASLPAGKADAGASQPSKPGSG